MSDETAYMLAYFRPLMKELNRTLESIRDELRVANFIAYQGADPIDSKSAVDEIDFIYDLINSTPRRWSNTRPHQQVEQKEDEIK